MNSLPKCPKNLSPEARKWWRQLNQDFVFEPWKLAILEQALRALDRCREAEAHIREHGLVLESGRANPCVTVARDAEQGFLRHWKALNLDVLPIGPVGRPPGK